MGSSKDVKVAEDKHNPGLAEKINKNQNSFRRKNTIKKNWNSKNWRDGFKVKCKYIEDYVFDANRFNQADDYMKTLKEICEYIGSNYDGGADICEHLKKEKNYLLLSQRTKKA